MLSFTPGSSHFPQKSIDSPRTGWTGRFFTAVLALGMLLAVWGRDVEAQTAPPLPVAADAADYNNRYDFFGGFAYAHFNGIGKVRATNLYGFNGQATAWIKPVFGLAASVRGDYGSFPASPNSLGITTTRISQHLFLFGPDFRLLRSPKQALGFHALLGGAYGSFSSGLHGAQPNSLGLYVDQLAFAEAIGASYDYNLSRKLSVRFIADYAPTHYGTAGQKEFAGSVGVVYKMGSLRK
ncbi:MAG TPA: hypothetical protein VGD59_06515 [Acidisarcina sp.]